LVFFFFFFPPIDYVTSFFAASIPLTIFSEAVALFGGSPPVHLPQSETPALFSFLPGNFCFFFLLHETLFFSTLLRRPPAFLPFHETSAALSYQPLMKANFRIYSFPSLFSSGFPLELCIPPLTFVKHKHGEFSFPSFSTDVTATAFDLSLLGSR